LYRRQGFAAGNNVPGGVIAVTHKATFTVETGRPHAFFRENDKGHHHQGGEVLT